MEKEINTKNEFAGVGAGRYRRPYMIREFIASKGFTMHSVSKKVGLSHTLVRETIMGAKNNKKVLNYLHELGCPDEFLSMPKQSGV